MLNSSTESDGEKLLRLFLPSIHCLLYYRLMRGHDIYQLSDRLFTFLGIFGNHLPTMDIMPGVQIYFTDGMINADFTSAHKLRQVPGSRFYCFKKVLSFGVLLRAPISL